jgi:hypothetical protein
VEETTSQPTPELPSEGVMYCTVHPTVETTLRCNKCGRPMCAKCAVKTPVGYRCKECVRGQQTVFYNSHSIDPLIQAIVALPLSAIGAGLISFISFGIWGWLIAFWVSSAFGALVADLAHRVVGKRRGRYSWLAVGHRAGSTAGAPLRRPFDHLADLHRAGDERRGRPPAAGWAHPPVSRG